MCGVVALLVEDPEAHVNQQLFDALTVLQHRGQDAAGMVTTSSLPGSTLRLKKADGLVKEVFKEDDMAQLRGNLGLGHVRYPTAGSSSCAEAQPLYTNYPHGICIAHNGTLTNTKALREVLAREHRHINTQSDSEVLLNIFAFELEMAIRAGGDVGTAAAGGGSPSTTREHVFAAATRVIQTCTGGFAVVLLIAGVGIVALRDPYGIRPLVFGRSRAAKGADVVVASESVAIDALGFTLERDVAPGEAIFVDYTGTIHTEICHPQPQLTPCVFEYVYFARPDSVMDGVQIYESRLRMGEALAHKINRLHPNHEIDVVIPIPDTSRASALQIAYALGCPFREGFIKNRYIARTFIMPGQSARRKSVRLKLNTIKSEFKDKNVLLVDDSIVRGTTSKEIVQLAREAGPNKIFFCSAAPEIKFPNVYGIDIPTRAELLAHNRTLEEIATWIDVDWLVYQDLADLEQAVRSVNPAALRSFESSCFSGSYVTSEVDEAFLTELEQSRRQSGGASTPSASCADSGKRGDAAETASGAANGGLGAAATEPADGPECEAIHNPKRVKWSNGQFLA